MQQFSQKCNYRPISVLPALSKIAEAEMHSQLSTYLAYFLLFYSSQYGFRKGHSTEFASLEFVDKIMSTLAEREIYLSVFMDLSKAFDSIDHQILFDKLVHYGVKPSAVNLIKSYLSNRKQYVEIGGMKSAMGTIDIGVPQGSILGPLLFLVYINDISTSSELLSTILYAEDSTFSANINNLGQTDDEISQRMNTELGNVYNWLAANRLCLNVSKTKYMVFNRTTGNSELKPVCK